MLTEVQEIRRQNLIKLIEREGSQPVVAERLKCSPGYISQWKTKHRPITEKTARKIEIAFDFPPGTFDKPLADDCSIREMDREIPYIHESPAVQRLAVARAKDLISEEQLEVIADIAEHNPKPKQETRTHRNAPRSSQRWTGGKGDTKRDTNKGSNNHDL